MLECNSVLPALQAYHRLAIGRRTFRRGRDEPRRVSLGRAIRYNERGPREDLSSQVRKIMEELGGPVDSNLAPQSKRFYLARAAASFHRVPRSRFRARTVYKSQVQQKILKSQDYPEPGTGRAGRVSLQSWVVLVSSSSFFLQKSP